MNDQNFEWDEPKRLANIEKHGIDFIDAMEVFDGAHLIIALPFAGEKRSMALGRLRNRPVIVVFTMRGARRRLISARRADRNETKAIEARLPSVED